MTPYRFSEDGPRWLLGRDWQLSIPRWWARRENREDERIYLPGESIETAVFYLSRIDEVL